jgi:hypothetical protein
VATSAFRCSAESLSLGESLVGTASTVSNWLLLEHAGPWGRHALRDARLPEGLGRELDHLQRRHRVRILLIRRPDRRTEGGVTVFAIHSGPDEPWIERTVLASIDEAAGLDLERLGHSERPGFEPSSVPLFVVCTHGRRDPCCAELGRPLARAVGGAFGDATWEGTHIGGDRFAGNMVAFPHGLYFGRLDERTGVDAATAYTRGTIDLEHLRGRSCRPMDVQAAELFMRQRLDATGVEDVTIERWRRRGDLTTVRASAPDGSYDVVIERGTGDAHLLTCHSEHAEPSASFALVSVERI